MNKKNLALFIFLFAVIFSLMLPSFAKRVYFENKNKGVILSLDYGCIKDGLESEKTPKLLNDAKALGINTVTLNTDDIKAYENLSFTGDFDLAIFLDAQKLESEDISSIKRFLENNNLKYINLRGNFENELQGKEMSNFLCSIIKEKNLVLVVSETKDQSANDAGETGYNPIKESAEGRLVRCYDTSYSANDRINPNLRFHQMLNSLKDRNTHFINLVPFNDKTASKKDNYYAMLSSVSMFIEEATDEGYLFEDFKMDYKGYNSLPRLNLAFGSVVCVLLCYIMLGILFGNIGIIIKITLAIFSVIGFVFPFVMPYEAEILYPLFLAVASSCFIISLVFYTVKKYSQKGFSLCLLLSLAVSFAGFSLRGFTLSAVLSGADYYLYFKTFRGVKLSLVVPVLYAAFAYVKLFGIAKPELKKCINARNIILASFGFVLLLAAAYIYIVRSGNSTVLSFETKIRNSLDIMMGIRPRTKEFLIGWPCLWLFVWYRVNTKQSFIPFVLSLGVAILSSSVINSFCHVFTPVLSIYHRTINGFILGTGVSIILLFLNSLIFRIFKMQK